MATEKRKLSWNPAAIHARDYRARNRSEINRKRREARAAQRAAGVKHEQTFAKRASNQSWAYDDQGFTSDAKRKANKRYYLKHKADILAKRRSDYEAQIESALSGRDERKAKKKRKLASEYLKPAVAAIAQRIAAVIDAEVAEFRARTAPLTKKRIHKALMEEKRARERGEGSHGIAD